MKNIRNFVASCERDFGLTQEALFDASELFDVSDFAKVSFHFDQNVSALTEQT